MWIYTCPIKNINDISALQNIFEALSWHAKDLQLLIDEFGKEDEAVKLLKDKLVLQKLGDNRYKYGNLFGLLDAYCQTIRGDLDPSDVLEQINTFVAHPPEGYVVLNANATLNKEELFAREMFYFILYGMIFQEKNRHINNSVLCCAYAQSSTKNRWFVDRKIFAKLRHIWFYGIHSEEGKRQAGLLLSSIYKN